MTFRFVLFLFQSKYSHVFLLFFFKKYNKIHWPHNLYQSAFELIGSKSESDRIDWNTQCPLSRHNLLATLIVFAAHYLCTNDDSTCIFVIHLYDFNETLKVLSNFITHTVFSISSLFFLCMENNEWMNVRQFIMSKCLTVDSIASGHIVTRWTKWCMPRFD